MQNLSFEKHKNFASSNNTIRKNFIASIKHQIKKLQFQTAEILSKSLQKSRKIKEVEAFSPTPKPWVAGSNPPAPAITEAKWLRFFSFWCVLFCISLSKTEMTGFFNSFISKNPISLSNNSNCSNRSVCYSIKKAAADLLYLRVFSSFKKYFSLFLIFLQTLLTFLSKYRIL